MTDENSIEDANETEPVTDASPEAGAAADMTPMVSVLIPVYNAEKYIGECIDSLLTQTFTDFEIVLCDDGSKDTSPALCDAYAERDGRVRVIHQANTGIPLARYNLIDAARGRYIQCVDADDTVPPDMLERLAAFAQRTDADMVCFGYTVIDDRGAAYSELTGLFPDGAVYSGDGRKAVYREFVSSWRLNTIWAKFFRRELFYAVTDRPQVRKNLNGEDRFITAGLLERAGRIGYLSGPLYNYRLSKDGMSRHYKLDFLEDMQFVNEYVLRLMERMGIADDAGAAAGFYRYCAWDIVGYIHQTARDRMYTRQELLSSYKRLLESELSGQVRREVPRYGDSRLQKLIYSAFAEHDYGRAISVVRLAETVKRILGRG